MPLRNRITTAAAASAAAVLAFCSADAFQTAFLAAAPSAPLSAQHKRQHPTGPTTRASMAENDAFAVEGDEEDREDAVLFSDGWEDGVSPGEEPAQSVPWKKNARWNSLNPNVKRRIVEEAQQRAIRNKKRREPAADKKRRLMMKYKKAQQQKKRDARVQRPRPLTDRTPLSEINPGDQLTGTIISLTNFGAYVDVGTECDGLLHIGQISRTRFVEHPREVLAPGNEVSVRVVQASPELKKLQLTMLDVEEVDSDDESDVDRIPLDDLVVDDELWGEIKRVTAYGAYVELGAEVDGFLHFMDHPEFGAMPDAPPSDFMAVGDRIRVWVSDVDMDKVRIKLTGNRPPGLPGPRREIRMY